MPFLLSSYYHVRKVRNVFEYFLPWFAWDAELGLKRDVLGAEFRALSNGVILKLVYRSKIKQNPENKTVFFWKNPKSFSFANYAGSKEVMLNWELNSALIDVKIKEGHRGKIFSRPYTRLGEIFFARWPVDPLWFWHQWMLNWVLSSAQPFLEPAQLAKRITAENTRICC